MLLCNNQGTILLAKNLTHHTKMKHVDVFIRDHVRKGMLDVEYCSMKDMSINLVQRAWLAKGVKDYWNWALDHVNKPLCHSPVNDITKSGKDPGMEFPNGSVKLQSHYAGNTMNYAR